MANLFRKKKPEQVYMLADGLRLTLEEAGQKESRIRMLFFKAILVYLLVMGTMGSLLSAVGVDCNWFVIAVVLFAGAMFCSFLYYSKKWENIGYILLFILMLVFGIGLRSYISSGVYAIANDLEDIASAFFESNASQTFAEQVANRRLAVTVSMCYIGWVGCMLVNVWISLHMRFLISGIASFAILSLAIYVEAIPNAFFVAMLMTELVMGFILFQNGHFRPVHHDRLYELEQAPFEKTIFAKRRVGKKKPAKISYTFSAKTAGLIMAAVFVLSFAVMETYTLVYPEKYFKEHNAPSPLKMQSMDTVENLTLMGIWAFFNYYPSTGGLTNGTLGGINAVQLDFEPDLELVYTPYTTERLYFKTFTGATYLPYQNKWARLADEEGLLIEEAQDETLQILEERYENDSAAGARGVMEIKNLAAYTGVYLPYYSENTDLVIWPGATQTYTYYPYFPQQSMQVTGEVDVSYLAVPQENLEVIAQFCKEADLTPIESTMQSDEVNEVVKALSAYYQENIPYTLRPGATQRKKDFVNYFLAENRRGYCAHFASSATLIFRYLGIPARYVEGYALDMADLAESGELCADKERSDYYDGYSMLGETNVMSVELTDANAHAWVEIYDPAVGWRPVEVTPASDEEEITSGFWRVLMNLMGGGENTYSGNGQTADAETEIGMESDAGRWIGVILVLLLFVFAVIIVFRVSFAKIRTWRQYKNANASEQLILSYQNYLKKVQKHDKGILDMHNYHTQLAWLVEHGYLDLDDKTCRQWQKILEQAGFSGRCITEEDKNEITERLKCIKKND